MQQLHKVLPEGAAYAGRGRRGKYTGEMKIQSAIALRIATIAFALLPGAPGIKTEQTVGRKL